MREYQVRICERLRVKFPGPTRHVWTAPALQEESDIRLAVGYKSCVRPHMMVPLSMAFCRRRSEVSSLLQDFPANLTSGGMVIPTTVPHSGRESFEGTAPLC